MCVIVDWSLVKAEYEEEINVPISMQLGDLTRLTSTKIVVSQHTL